MVEALLLLLAAAQGGKVTAVEPPAEPLVCRYETFISRLIARRKLCLTDTEWQARASENSEASRRSLFELMGNTACGDGGICTSD